MSNGKGDTRRPRAITRAEEAQRWDATFVAKVPARIVEQPEMVDAVGPCPCCGDTLRYDQGSGYYPCRTCALWWTAWGMKNGDKCYSHSTDQKRDT